MVKLDGIELNKDINLYLDKAGRSLQWSSTFDCLAGCCMLMSVLSYSELMTEDKDIARTIGAISAAMAVASGVTAIYFKYRTGMELRLAAGSISVKF